MIFKTLRMDKILWEAAGARRILPWDTSKIRGWGTKKSDLESVAPEMEVKPGASCFSQKPGENEYQRRRYDNSVKCCQ